MKLSYFYRGAANSCVKLLGSIGLASLLPSFDVKQEKILSDHFGFVNTAHASVCANCGCGTGCNCNGGAGAGECGNSDNCACDNSCTSSSSCNPPSTPFLYVQKGQSFLMDNDVMFGKPTSLFPDIESGITAYRADQVTPDMYLVQKPVTVNKDGEIKLQIREIEPEISAIFTTQLRRLAVEADEDVFVTSDYTGCVKVNIKDHNTTNKLLKCLDQKGIDVSEILTLKYTCRPAPDGRSVTLETGEYLDITFGASDITDHYLILESWYRDWTLGDVYSENQASHFTISPYQRTIDTAKRGTLASLAALFIGYLGFTGSFSGSRSTDSDHNLISGSFGVQVPRANADTPSCSCKSLELSYRDTATEKRFEVVQPRYARPYTVATKIPKDALRDGKVSIRITATKRHKVSGIGVMKGTPVKESGYETLELQSAYHHREQKDHAETLNKNNDEYVKTYPSDILTLSFKVPTETRDGQPAYKYVFSIGGTYAPATKEDQAVVGNWVPKLDDEARAFIEDVYKENLGGELKFKDS